MLLVLMRANHRFFFILQFLFSTSLFTIYSAVLCSAVLCIALLYSALLYSGLLFILIIIVFITELCNHVYVSTEIGIGPENTLCFLLINTDISLAKVDNVTISLPKVVHVTISLPAVLKLSLIPRRKWKFCNIQMTLKQRKEIIRPIWVLFHFLSISIILYGSRA